MRIAAATPSRSRHPAPRIGSPATPIAIERDLTAPLDLRQLAGPAGVTRFQVIRDFKRMTGLTPGAYLRNRRLRHAAHLISQGASAAAAAAAARFADQSHLSRTFKRIHGITPAAFQRAHRSH